MSSILQIQEAIKDYRLADLKRLSDLSGVPFRTLYKIKRRQTNDPLTSTTDALYRALLADGVIVKEAA
jgi:2-hydroxychromene-2-carboxylate isomerase